MFYKSYINNKTVFKSDFIKAEHFFTTRESIIKTKNDNLAEVVMKNKQDICHYLQISQENLLSPSQTHTAHVEIAKQNIKSYPDTDSLIVTDNNIAIFLNFADCTPLIFYDEKLNIGAIAHAGWRGTAKRIAIETLKKMEQLGSNPQNISVAIGAAIGKCCYNVGEDVLYEVKNTVRNFNGLSEIRDELIYIDLQRINERQIREYGVEKIDIAPFCTCCNNDMFFSYRKEQGTTNRHSAVLKIN